MPVQMERLGADAYKAKTDLTYIDVHGTPTTRSSKSSRIAPTSSW